MNYEKVMKKLEEVYALALDNKDVEGCLNVIDTMLRAGAVKEFPNHK